MAKINPCFKRIFVFFNVLFAIFGVVVFALGLLGYFIKEVEDKTGAIVLLVIGVVIVILSVLGACGAQKENKNVLIAFFVFLCVVTIVLLRIAIPMASARTEIISQVEVQLQAFKPLDKANPQLQRAINLLQQEFECCGLFDGYQDWGSQIPDSCNCVQGTDQCQQTYGIRNKMVHSKSCGPILMGYLNIIFNIVLGVMFGLAGLALLGSVMSLGMIIRITSIPRTAPPAFALSPHPPKYSELHHCA